MTPLPTDSEIAEINDLLRSNLKPPTKVYTQHGAKTLRITLVGDAASVLSECSDDHYKKVIEAIRTSDGKGPQRDRGVVKVKDHVFCWWFRYKDSTGTYFMPNGHRELMIAFEDQVEGEDEV